MLPGSAVINVVIETSPYPLRYRIPIAIGAKLKGEFPIASINRNFLNGERPGRAGTFVDLI
jgi:hypothetical protein